MKSNSIRYGLNQETVFPRDDKYVRCRRCGFICNTDRDVYSHEGSRQGWGIINTAYTSATYDIYGAGIDDYYDSDIGTYDGKVIYDPIVTSGCPQCGTLLYK